MTVPLNFRSNPEFNIKVKFFEVSMLSFPFKRAWGTGGCKTEVLGGKQVSDMLNFPFKRPGKLEGVKVKFLEASKSQAC